MPARPWRSSGRRPRDSQGLEGIISSPIMHWRAFFILFHHFYTEKTGYFLRITASRPVGHVFVWPTRLQLIYHLDFIND